MWQAFCSCAGDRLVGAGHHGGAVLPGGDLAGQVGPGDDRDPVRAGAGDLGDDLAHPVAGAELDALHEADQQRARRQQLAPVGQVVAAGVWAGTASTTRSAPASAAAGSAVACSAGGSGTPGR